MVDKMFISNSQLGLFIRAEDSIAIVHRVAEVV
jgi:hypothetical protein